MEVRCPKCKSDFIKTYSRTKYFVKSGVCFVMILPCYLVYKAMLKAQDIDPVIILGLVGGITGPVVFSIAGIYSFIRGVLVKEIRYK